MTISLGEKLKQRREQLGLSVNDIAERMHTSPRSIEDLEAGHYADFGAHVYARGFFQKLLKVLELKEKDAFTVEFESEWWRGHESHPVLPLRSPRRVARYFSVSLRKYFIIGFTGIVLAGIFFLFGSKLNNFLQAPRLVIEIPADWATAHESIIRVKGNTARESQLTVNGRDVTVNESGAFDQDIEVQPGMSTLEFTAQNRFGKSTVVERHIVVE